MDFIKDTYAELVKRMGKCIVNQIVDDLFGKNVLSTEEMNVINDENVSQVASRKLILMVLNKGSESCNLFMKCLEKYDHLLFQDLCLIDGMGSLVNIEKLIFDNIKMYEEDAKKLAEGLKDLKRLVILHLSHLTTIGNGMDDIVESICSEPRDLQEIKLVDCCLSGKAVKILAQNIKHFPKLRMLDSSENNLKEEGNGSVTMLVDSLNGFPDMTVLMLPCGCDVRLCLDTLLQHLIQMPRLVRLGLKNWHLTDTEISKLSAFFKENLKDLQQLDLSGNCVTSDGWLSFTEALRDLKELTTLDLSSEHSLQPYAGLVLELSRVISKLKGLQKVRLCGWQLDSIDLQKINSAKAGCEGEFQLLTA
ncbi:NLR family CARD domain-containing protein 4 isoform X2 [Microcaecilia unicolor]|uniref:NLR family CARD domain-containing protein 4 isoform X2 n=1 Tax=Microcaecilia unicolor TaxID=1415580 RepID=A0A6P7XLU8_9AMPH|nr:NLR family CARD domain-containing protein 4 isoform X2 [Microcaecilia unicolor]